MNGPLPTPSPDTDSPGVSVVSNWEESLARSLFLATQDLSSRTRLWAGAALPAGALSRAVLSAEASEPPPHNGLFQDTQSGPQGLHTATGEADGSLSPARNGKPGPVAGTGGPREFLPPGPCSNTILLRDLGPVTSSLWACFLGGKNC